VLVLIYLIVNRISNRKNALIAAALYGFSPLPFFATSSFASFDSTAAFWMLLSLLMLLMKKPIPSAVALGIGTAYKYFPLLLLPAALFYLSTNRQKIHYALASVATIAVIQLTFILTDFNAWLNNVILFQLDRPAFGASIFNLISLHPTLMDVQTQLTAILPIALLLVFILMAFSEGKSALGLLKNSALILLVAVFFSKVVLFYALWYIPLVCILIVALMKRASAMILVPFFILQVALLLGWYTYYVSLNTRYSLILAYVYLVASGLLLAWLFYDRLILPKTKRMGKM